MLLVAFVPSKLSPAFVPTTVFSCASAVTNRDPEAILNDVLQGKISTNRARKHYGVEINLSSQQVDMTITEDLRRGR